MSLSSNKGLTSPQNGLNGHSLPQADDGDGIATLWARYLNVKESDANKTALLEEVLGKYYTAKDMLDQVKKLQSNDIELINQMHRNEDSALTHQRQVLHLQGLLNRDPFIMIIIDGNTTVFHPNLLVQGEEGGKQAAAVLQAYIADWVGSNVVDSSPSMRVACKVWADLNRLAVGCQRAGLVDSGQTVLDFFRGFVDANPLFDFMDAGKGESRTNAKVTEHFKLHLFNYHCRQIMLGCGHEDQYAEMLEQYKKEPSVVDRVTLLEGVPLKKELRGLGYRTADLNGVFHSKDVDLRAMDFPLTPGHGPGHVVPPSQSPIMSIWHPGTKAHSQTPSTASSGPKPIATPQTISQRSTLASPVSWANTAAKNAHAPLEDSRPASTGYEQRVEPGLKRNRKGQRLDDELPYDREGVLHMKKLKCCNQHYIGIGCCHYNAGKADKCPHNHDYKLSAADRDILRVVSRETPCKRGHGCDDPKCIYGHKCPFPVATEGSLRGSGVCLNGPNCRFPSSMHGMDLEAVRSFKVT